MSYVDLKLKILLPPSPPSSVLGFQVCVTTPDFGFFVYLFKKKKGA
jgi:hypothetical protein